MDSKKLLLEHVQKAMIALATKENHARSVPGGITSKTRARTTVCSIEKKAWR